MNKIAATLFFIIGISYLLAAQDTGAPKIFRDSTKNRYTLYPTSPKADPAPPILEGTPTNTDIDTIVSGGEKLKASTPVMTESGALQAPVTESGLPVLPKTQSRVSESGLPIAPVSPKRSEKIESGTLQTPVTESGLPVMPETQPRVSESGLPIAPDSAERSEMTETESLQTPVTESGLPVLSETHGINSDVRDITVPEEKQSGESESIILQPGVPESSKPSPETNSPAVQNDPTSIPAAPRAKTEKQPSENKVQTSSDEPIRDWSNPPGFIGYSSNAKYKTKKHVLRKNKHKYRPHQKYQRKKTIRSPRF